MNDDCREDRAEDLEQWLERSLSLWRELASSIELANQAILASNLSAMETYTARQRELCRVLLHLQEKHGSVKTEDRESRLPKDLRDRCEALRRELWEGQLLVCRLNRRQIVWLRRSRRTTDIFCRVLANAEATYSQPVVAR
jgi:hypothetical protein